MEIYHNSRNLKYRSPFGAVCTNETVSLSLRAPIEAVSAAVRLWSDDTETLIPMNRKGDFFTADVKMPETPQLVWYYFIIEISGGQKAYYFNNRERLGGEGEIRTAPDGNSYQITVCKTGFKTPDWFKNSIMYQIFPDRFFCGEKLPKKRSEYTIHEDWYEPFTFQKHPYEDGPACNDFYGGNLQGIIKKLPYLNELGISVIYLNPIFEAYSNHRYDTASYDKIDPMLGTQEDFEKLCSEGRKYGIRIILDGVFSHTGSDSVYFNKYGSYGENSGAWRDIASPYRAWYQFREDGSYDSWWGCTNLPNVNETEPTYLDYILRDNDAIIKKWLRCGASGWRLDVADELPDEFIKILRREVKSVSPDALVIGEVWEDASNKISYGKMREYLLGDELDSVMNYPFKDGMVDFLMGSITAESLCAKVMSVCENYPQEVLYSLMNIAGTHDTMRIKTVLGGENIKENATDKEKWDFSLEGSAETTALKRVMLMAFMQMTFVGVPCIYYGDEIGMEGLSDPYNRKPYSWRKINPELLARYKKLIALRNKNDFLRTGSFVPLYAKGSVFVYMREISGGKDVFGKKAHDGAGIFAVNCGNTPKEITVKNLTPSAKKLLGKDGKITILPMESRIFM